MSMYNEDDVALDIHDVDPDSQVRFRYHTRFTVREGDDPTQAIQVLKDDFAKRIPYYQNEFNNQPQFFAKLSSKNVGKALSSFADESKYLSFFEGDALQAAKEYRSSINPKARVEIIQVIPPIGLPDKTAVSVEDVVVSTPARSEVHSRIVIYKINEHGKIVSLESFSAGLPSQSGVLEAANNYYEALKVDKNAVAKTFAKDPIIEDPKSYTPQRDFDTVYNGFFNKEIGKISFTRTPERTYAVGNKVVQLVEANVELKGKKPFINYTVQLLEFNEKNEIVRLNGYLKPSQLKFGEGGKVKV